MIYTDRIHLIGENLEELHAFASSIGLNKCWFHNKLFKPHYDLINKKRKTLIDADGMTYISKALEKNAILVPTRKIIEILKISYSFPTTPEEVEKYQNKHKWEINRPLTEKEKKTLDEIYDKIQKDISNNT